MTTDPWLTAAAQTPPPDHAPDPRPRPQDAPPESANAEELQRELDAARAREQELQAELERARAVQAASVTTAPPAKLEQPASTVEVPEQAGVEHALAPGSAGPAVRELAGLLEQLGKETYLSRGGNPDDVLHDDLLHAVRDVLATHAKETLPVEKLEGELRQIAILGEVSGEVWRLLRHKAAQQAEAQ